MRKSFTGRKIAACVMTVLLFAAAASAQITEFNFQGKLNDGGNAANGSYDFQFKLFDSITGGAQVGTTLNRTNVAVNGGVFSTTLDFGSGAFLAGSRFLEIGVRPAASPNAYVVLGARQQILSVPYAVNAAQATAAVTAQSAQSAQTAQSAALATNSTQLGGFSPQSYARLNVDNGGIVQATTVVANSAVTSSGTISAAGNLTAGGSLNVTGAALQPLASFGLPKAMAYVEALSSGTSITRCYNGVTGASTPTTCGFTVTEPLGSQTGVYSLNFGFPVNGRFAVVTPISQSTPLQNIGANIRFTGSNLEVFMFRTGEVNNTLMNGFVVIVY